MKILYKREGRLAEFEHGFKNLILRKTQLLKKYTNIQIESMLRKNIINPTNGTIGFEVINTLMPLGVAYGLLKDMDSVFGTCHGEQNL